MSNGITDYIDPLVHIDNGDIDETLEDLGDEEFGDPEGDELTVTDVFTAEDPPLPVTVLSRPASKVSSSKEPASDSGKSTRDVATEKSTATGSGTSSKEKNGRTTTSAQDNGDVVTIIAPGIVRRRRRDPEDGEAATPTARIVAETPASKITSMEGV